MRAATKRASLERHVREAVAEMQVDTPYYGRSLSRYLATVEALWPVLGTVESVAEVGPSPLAVAFARAGFDASVYGLYRTDAERERFASEGVSLHEWNLLESDAPPHSHDLVLFLEVIEHLPVYPATVLRTVGDLVDQDGTLLLSTPELHRLSNKFRMLVNRPLFGPFTETERGRYHVREYSLPEMRRYVGDAGLTVSYDGRFGPIPLSRSGAVLRKIARVVPAFTTHFYIACVKGPPE